MNKHIIKTVLSEAVARRCSVNNAFKKIYVIFTGKHEERIKKIKETRDPGYIYQNELDKACFQYDMAYGDFKN